MNALLALDQGTTSSRALVFDIEGRLLALAQRELTQHYPAPGEVEHDPLELWQTQADCAREALASARLAARDIAAIGITNQRETTLVWERATGRPVHVDGTDPGVDVRGVVAADLSRAMFTIVQTVTDAAWPPGRVRMPGLDDDRLYRVAVSSLTGGQGAGQSPLEWATSDTVLTGRQLSIVGLRPMVQQPQQAIVVDVTAAD